jgi:hypothetical protein
LDARGYLNWDTGLYRLRCNSAATGASRFRGTLARVGAQTSNPRPGSSLVVELAPRSGWRRLELAVVLLPGA